MEKMEVVDDIKTSEEEADDSAEEQQGQDQSEYVSLQVTAEITSAILSNPQAQGGTSHPQAQERTSDPQARGRTSDPQARGKTITSPARGGRTGASPTPGGRTGASPARGGRTSDSPARGGRTGDSPARGGRTGASPASGGRTGASPARGGRTGSSLARGGRTSDSPARGGRTGDSPARGGRTGASPARGGRTGDSPARGGRTSDSPARGGRTGNSPARGGRTGDSPARGGRTGDSPARGGRTGDSPARGGRRETGQRQNVPSGAGPSHVEEGMEMHEVNNPRSAQSGRMAVMRSEEQPRRSAQTDGEGCFSCGLCSEDTVPSGGRFVFRWYNIVLGMVGIILYYVDVGTDISLVVQFFRQGQWVYGGVTLAIILLSYLVTASFFICIWISSARRVHPLFKYGLGITLGMVTPLCMPVYLMAFHFYHGIKSRTRGIGHSERKRFVAKMKEGLSGSVLFRLLEVYLEAAPQLVWQMYILLITTPKLHDSLDGVTRILAVLSSLVNLALVQAVFIDTNRYYSGVQVVMSRSAQFFNFLWRLVQTAGRVYCIALFASLFDWWILVILLPHWLIMSLWNFRKLNPHQHDQTSRVLTSVANGYFSIFSQFANATIRPSRFWYIVMSVVQQTENILMLLLWLFFNPDPIDFNGNTLYLTWAALGTIFHIPIYLLLQVLFYVYFHPNSDTISVPKTQTWKQILCDSNYRKTQLSLQETFA